jgi:hypothetical protein
MKQFKFELTITSLKARMTTVFVDCAASSEERAQLLNLVGQCRYIESTKAVTSLHIVYDFEYAGWYIVGMIVEKQNEPIVLTKQECSLFIQKIYTLL